jgi:hypothetical protein
MLFFKKSLTIDEILMRQDKKEKKVKRLQFDFAEKAVKQLDDMVEMTDASSRAEVVRNALRLYEYIIKGTEEGYDFKIRKRLSGV